MIDWTNAAYPITPHFTVRDALWLPHWDRLANEDDGLDDTIKANILATLSWSEEVRDILDFPMQTTSLYRPPSYSALPEVGGSSTDVHTRGVAHDFVVPGMAIEDAKILIRPHLTPLVLRMEAGTTTWVHLDSWPAGPSGREFIA